MRPRTPRGHLLLVAWLLAYAGCAGCGEGGTQGVETLLVPSSDALAFGGIYIGASPLKSLQLRVLGGGSVTVTSVVLEGDAAFSVGGAATTGFVIGSGAVQALDVTYRPTAVRADAATLVLHTDLDDAPELRIGLSGEGLAPRDCDDDQDCTTDTFDEATGACTYVRREGTCDDGNACTTEDVCVEGRCLGRALDCADDSACTRDLCDADSGCVSLTDPAACDDENPCTAESCDADGCHHDDLANGTPCGPITGCRAVPLCLFGRCERIDAPDGTPCFDGDACTTGDTCTGGTCAGTREQRTPAVTAVRTTFGTPATDSLMLGTSRIVFSHLLDGSRERALTLVENRGGALVVLDEKTVPGHALLAATGDDAFVVLRDSTPPALVVYSVSGSGRLVERGHAEVDTTLVLGAAGLDGLLVFCAHTPSRPAVQAWSIVDPDRPVFSSEFGTCTASIFVDRRTRRALAGSNTIDVWDLAAPAAPVLVGQLAARTNESFVGSRAGGDGLFLVQSIRDNVGTLRAFDAATLAPLGEAASTYGGDLQVGARRAFLTNVGAASRVYDFTTPTAPTQLPAASVASLGGRLVVGPSLVVTGFSGGDQRVFEHGGTPFTLTPRLGRAQGRMANLVLRPWGLHVVSNAASHRYDLSTPDAPRLDSGGPFAGTSVLVGLGATGSAPFVVQPLFWPFPDTRLGQNPYGFTLEGGLWTGAADASSPLTLGTVQQPLWGAVVDGRLLVNVDPFYNTDAISLAVRDLATLTPAFPTALPPAVKLPLESAQSTANARSRLSMAYFAASPTGRHVAIALNRDVETTGSPSRTTRVHGVALADLTDPAHPVLRWSSSGPESVIAIATDGSSVLVLEGSMHVPDFDLDRAPTMLRIRRGQGGSPGAIEVPGGHRIAHFDGRVAHVLTPEGVTIVDTVGTPRLLGTVVLPEHPLDARVVGDRLVVTSQSRLSVVSPPCPP